MKRIYFAMVICFVTVTAIGQANEKKQMLPDSTKKMKLVEAACAECQFKLPGKSCDLAVRIKGKAYFVDGTSIDEHGDAHAKDGFCNAVRKAWVQGELVDNRFKVTYFKLVADPVKKEMHKE